MERNSAPADGPHEKLRLKVVEGNAAGTVIEIDDELVIGRQSGGDGSLASDIEISRRHARVYCDEDGHFRIEDLDSTNGTYINGRRLEGPAILEAGDRVQVGASALVVQVGSLQPTPPASDTIAPAIGSGHPPAGEEAPAAAVEPEPVEPEPFPPGESEPLPALEPLESEPLPAVEPEQAITPFALRIEVDIVAGRATVILDDSADEVTLVHENGRWRIA